MSIETKETNEDKQDKNIKENIFARLGVTKPYTVFVLIAVVCILGTFAFSKFKLELFPNMNLPYVILISAIDQEKIATEAESAGLTMEDYMRLNYLKLVKDAQDYASGLESSVYRFVGVKNMTSVISAGLVVVQIELPAEADIDASGVDIIQAIEMVDYQKSGYTKPRTLKISPNLLPVYSFTTTYDKADKDIVMSLIETKVKGAGGVADVSAQIMGAEGLNGFAMVNGKLASSFSVNKISDAPTVDVVKNVKAELRALKETYPDLEIIETLNQGMYIEQSIGDVLSNLLIGGILAIIILFLFMRNWKMTLAIAIAIPLSVIGAFVFMYFMGIGLNIISMSALALVVGMLVDNSVIVLENIFRLKSKGLPIQDAAIKGASQIFNAIVASTLTTICVFFPMFFLTGLVMEIFMDLVWVIILSLFASLIVAVAFLPAIVSSFKIGERPKHENFITRTNDWISGKLSRPTNAIKTAYDKSLRFCVRFKWWALSCAVLVFALSCLLIPINGFEIMPATDEGEFSATVSLDRDVTDAEARKMADDFTVLLSNTSVIAVDVKTVSVSYSTGMGADMRSVMGGGGKSLSINIVLRENHEPTNAVAENAYNAMVTYCADPLRAWYSPDPNIDGLPITDISISSGMMSGMVADGVTVTLACNEPNGLIANMNLAYAMSVVKATLDEKIGSAGGILKYDDSSNSLSIVRSNGRITASLDIKVKEGASVSTVQSRVDAEMAILLNTAEFKERGITKLEDGFSKQLNETMSQMMLALLIGLILLYLVMVAMFQSFKLPFIVMITIPLAFTGAFFLLCVTGMTFSIVAVIGLVILMGVIVNNGIVLIDYIKQIRGDGYTIQEAVIIGAKTRARPILMTALTTIIALLPSAMGYGSSGAMMQPLAIASIGGLFYATIMSLIIVPAFYAIMFCRKDRQEQRNMLKQSTEAENDQKNNSSKLENEHDAGASNVVLSSVKGKKSQTK